MQAGPFALCVSAGLSFLVCNSEAQFVGILMQKLQKASSRCRDSLKVLQTQKGREFYSNFAKVKFPFVNRVWRNYWRKD